MERDRRAVADVEDGDVVHLAHAADGERGGMGAVADARVVLHRLDMDDHVALGKRALDRVLDRVGDRVPLADGGARRDRDHDVGEVAPGRVAHPQPPHVHGGSIRAIASRAASAASAGARSMSTSTFRRISRTAATSTRQATNSAASESPFGYPAAAAASPARTAADPSRSPPKWSAFACSAALPNRRAVRSETAVRLASIAITTTSTRNVHQAASTVDSSNPVSRATARPAMNRLRTTRIVASPSAARCSAFPWPYWWAGSAGRTATPTANSVSSAATRSVPEWSASESSPSEPLASPVTSFSSTSTAAAATDTSAVRRCGCIAGG